MGIALATLCNSNVHCPTCRDPSQTEWRASLAQVYRLPHDAPDFECPRGKPWNYSRGFGDWLASIFKRFGIRKQRGCGCAARQAALNRYTPQLKSLSAFAAALTLALLMR